MGVEKILPALMKRYNVSKDLTEFKEIASVYEQVSDVNAFEIYKFLDDKESMGRVAKKYFVESMYDFETLFEKMNIKPESSLYNERGDFYLKQAKDELKTFGKSFFAISSYENSIESYIKAKEFVKVDQAITEFKGVFK